MINQLAQMAAVLAIVVFLISGCSMAASNSFNYNTMRQYEQLSRQIPFLLQNPHIEVTPATLDKADLAYANYMAGQVSIAGEKYDLAEEYFKKAYRLMGEVMAELAVAPLPNNEPDAIEGTLL